MDFCWFSSKKMRGYCARIEMVSGFWKLPVLNNNLYCLGSFEMFE